MLTYIVLDAIGDPEPPSVTPEPRDIERHARILSALARDTYAYAPLRDMHISYAFARRLIAAASSSLTYRRRRALEEFNAAGPGASFDERLAAVARVLNVTPKVAATFYNEGVEAVNASTRPAGCLTARHSDLISRGARAMRIRRTGHAPQRATNARRRGSRRRCGASSRSSSQDPGDSDPDPPGDLGTPPARGETAGIGGQR